MIFSISKLYLYHYMATSKFSNFWKNCTGTLQIVTEIVTIFSLIVPNHVFLENKIVQFGSKSMDVLRVLVKLVGNCVSATEFIVEQVELCDSRCVPLLILTISCNTCAAMCHKHFVLKKILNDQSFVVWIVAYCKCLSKHFLLYPATIFIQNWCDGLCIA